MDSTIEVALPPIFQSPFVEQFYRAVARDGWELWMKLSEEEIQRIRDVLEPDGDLVLAVDGHVVSIDSLDSCLEDGQIGIRRLPTDHHYRGALRHLIRGRSEQDAAMKSQR